MGAPPGGPLRTTPPVLLSVTPDSGVVNAVPRSIVFTFDDVISDRDVEKYFLMSPEDGRTRVSWHRHRIEVRPRRGFRPNTAYSVTMLPGLQDLRGNAIKTGRTIVFSTGASIPPYMVLGRVFDWLNERVAPKAVVQVIRRPDSLPYVGVADSAGQFGIGPLAGAQYTVLAFMDNNSNRALDRGEAWDSLSVSVGGGTSPFVELLLAPRDTFPPRLLTVTASDTFSVSASFDKALNPDWEIRADRFRLLGADSTPLRIVSAARRGATDSTATRDTSAARRDSVPARRDTAALRRSGAIVAPPPKPSRPAPPREVTLRLDSLTPMHPGRSYRLSAIDARGLLGRPHTSERVFTVARARTDSARAPADSNRARSGARPAVPARPPAGAPRKP